MSVSVHQDGDVAVVTIDNPPVNATSHAVRQGLIEALAETETNPAIRAVVLTCAGKTFVAGADIREFGMAPQSPSLPEVIDAIEAAGKPWVAALHGTALGGGLELALGCHARVADAATKLGLPEVNLGLIPGAGGTVRLPRLVPGDLALTIIAGGKPVAAGPARAAGLLDAISMGDLVARATELARGLTMPLPTRSRPVRLPPDPAGFETLAAKLRKRAGGQHSPGAAIDAVRRALDLPAKDAFHAEKQAFLALKDSRQSAALRRIFFAERQTLKDPRTRAPARSLSQIGVVGGGTMGAGIAAACLIKDLPVTLVEQDADASAAAHGKVVDLLKVAAERRVIPDLPATLARLDVADELAALADVDLVIEAVFEDMEVKQTVFRQLDAATRPDAVLATNTSYLDVNEIAAVLRDPSRALGLHFFSPAHIMKLLEIVLPDAVADDVVATAAALARRLGKIGVLAGVCDGFIGNRIMSAYRQEADYLLEDGALPDQVDGAMREFGFAMGVFEMQDLAGLDIAWAMRRRRAASRPATERYVRIADTLCEAGRFGRKTGAGWYDYVDNNAQPSAFVAQVIDDERRARGIKPQAFSPDQIMSRILGRLAAEAQAVLSEGIARSAEDIDVVMTSGYGYPRWQGSVLEPRHQRIA